MPRDTYPSSPPSTPLSPTAYKIALHCISPGERLIYYLYLPLLLLILFLLAPLLPSHISSSNAPDHVSYPARDPIPNTPRANTNGMAPRSTTPWAGTGAVGTGPRGEMAGMGDVRIF
ncbi:hypothetical protein I312_104683 [Cryptococcus bacillisporus CA1280]|uniref:Uncharacterized protein n=2 Tax=Cryptococcus gattii TaxID=552467 RepID=A0A0D0UD50_CRYGA|nr:hypothetical protein I312_04747 [Cryptococcus bacillisporus CA1280]KIR58771.1 hypothetical protein I314_05183 [Cryptococcus bacillisporus CA1873]|eukprot:KIR58771.1 hypothetical protein I314_05183 [Cryptococcus gattii CA1873]